MEEVGKELELLDERFAGVTKKGVRDRVYLLLDQHRRQEAWSKKQSGTDEEFGEKSQLLTELQELFDEKDTLKLKQKEEQQAELAQAAQIRADACLTLGSKSRSRRKSDATPTDSIAVLPEDEVHGDAVENASKSKSPPAKRRSYGSAISNSTEAVVSYLKLKHQASQEMETERLAFEKEKFQQQKIEAEERMKAEREDREARRKKEDDDRKERTQMLNILSRLADKLK